jgi:hypothetical protein
MYYFKKFQKREIGVIKRKQPQTTANNRKQAKEVQKTAKEEQKIKKRLPKTTRPKHQPSKIFFKGEVKNNS